MGGALRLTEGALTYNRSFDRTLLPGKFFWTTVACALACVIAVWACTGQGVGLTLDSTRYVEAAKHPAAMLGVPAWSYGRDVRYPPLLPAVLSVAGVWHGDAEDMARWLNLLVCALNVMLIGLIIRDAGCHRNWIAVWCVATFAAASNTLMLHSFVWSEPLYLVWMLALIVTLRRYCDAHATVRLLLWAAVFTSLGLLTRYAGGSLLLGGILAILVLSPVPFLLRLRHVAIYAGVSLILPGIWVLGNLLIAGSATGREISAMSPVTELPRLGITVLNWWAPEYLPRWAKISIVLWIGVTIAICAVRVLWIREAGLGKRRTSLLPVLFILSFTYVAFLFVSRTWFDHRTPLDWRILSPLFATGLLFNSLILQQLWRTPRFSIIVHPLVAGLCVAVLVGHCFNSMVVAKMVAAEGLGWNRVRFHDVRLIQTVRGLPESAILYSNDAAALAARMERRVSPLPVLARGGAREESRMRVFLRDARGGKAFVLYFPKKGQTADESLKSLRRIATLRPQTRGSKWTLYQLVPTIRPATASQPSRRTTRPATAAAAPPHP